MLYPSPPTQPLPAFSLSSVSDNLIIYARAYMMQRETSGVESIRLPVKTIQDFPRFAAAISYQQFDARVRIVHKVRGTAYCD